MSHSDSRIPEDMLADIFAEAARLHAETNKGYSVEELKQICLEAHIPPHIVEQAIKEVEGKRLREQERQKALRKYIQVQARKAVSVGLSLILPAIALISLLLVRSQLQTAAILPNPELAVKIPLPPERDRIRRENASYPPQSTVDSASQDVIQPASASEQKRPSNVEVASGPNERHSPNITSAPETPPKLGIAPEPKREPTPEVNSPPPKKLQEKVHAKVSHKRKPQVLQAVGEPDRKSDTGNLSRWYYDNITDPDSGETVSVILIFNDGVVDGVSFR